MILKCETRDKENPRGKAKVWFCAHPDDHPIYFESVKDEILNYQNCAIYYDAEPTARYSNKNLVADLAEMKLFVMPVTTKLLTTPNRAIDVELKLPKDQPF